MDQTRILPGDLVVAKGALKIGGSLPEGGLKDVVPDGSWLEQKQIEAAIEARKQLIEIERIEKSGTISHAKWCEDLMLAEVTQKVGSYWQYLGHNIGTRLYLHPEEALFLMETNCLLLKNNDVKVSLQQAYALLLRGKISSLEYKVYAALSRLGYRVYRHQHRPCVGTPNSNRRIDLSKKDIIIESNPITKDIPADKQPETASTNKKNYFTKINMTDKNTSNFIQQKLLKLKNRKIKIMNYLVFDECFKNIPEFIGNEIIFVKAPLSKFIPNDIHITNTSYFLNVELIRKKTSVTEQSPPSNAETEPATTTAAANTISPAIVPYGPNIRQFRTPLVNHYISNHLINQFNLGFPLLAQRFNFRFLHPNTPFRHLFFRGQHRHFNYFNLNMFFQRPYPYFSPRVTNPAFPRPNVNLTGGLNRNVQNYCARRKRTRLNAKTEHFEAIRRLAVLVRDRIINCSVPDNAMSQLQQLIQSYNTRYRTRVRLTNDFNVIVDENIIDTIDLEDDEECKVKRTRNDDNSDGFDGKLNKVKHCAAELHALELKNEATSRHRRVFSNLIKMFNKCYKVDYYINENYQILNRNHVVLDSSSHSEIESTTTKTKRTKKSKKLKNPFFILKQLSEKQGEPVSVASTSQVLGIQKKRHEIPNEFKYSEITKNTFKRGWLPSEQDFGRAEVPRTECTTEVLNIQREEFLFDYMKIQPDKFNNWLDIKLSFLECLRESSQLFLSRSQSCHGVKSIVTLGDSTDTASILNKLSIIKTNEEGSGDSNLAIHFDVYTRDINNFKKTNRPLPHFRVICMNESNSIMPAAADVLSLHSKYNDNVTIVYAVTGKGSISYLQINPEDLPVFISSNNIL